MKCFLLCMTFGGEILKLRQRNLSKQCVCSDSYVLVLRFFTMCAVKRFKNCTPRQCSPLRRKFIECSINSPALSLLLKHLVIGQRQKAPNFSAFHWSPQGSLISIGQHFVNTNINTEIRSGPKHRIGQGYAGRAKLQQLAATRNWTMQNVCP